MACRRGGGGGGVGGTGEGPKNFTMFITARENEVSHSLLITAVCVLFLDWKIFGFWFLKSVYDVRFQVLNSDL